MTKIPRLCFLFALAGCLLASYPRTRAVAQQASTAGAAGPGYNLRFGKQTPFLPSQARSETGDFIQPGAFPKAEYCGHCHKDTHAQWRESAHSNAFREPFYIKNVNLLIDSKGIEFSRHCEGCHNPIALFSGALTRDSPVVRAAFDDDGLTCTTCHSIQKVQNTSGTGSYVMGVPAVMVNADGVRIPGEVSYQEILESPKLHSRAVMQDFYRTSEFCAVCHKAAVPRQLNEYKWLRAFSVYDEWQQSSWSRQSPLPFYKKDKVYSCQDCHMKLVAAKSDYGADAGQVSSHRWLGANTAIPKFYGFDEQLEKTVQFLGDETLAIDAFALERTDGSLEAPLNLASTTLKPGEQVTLDLVIQNKGIGHSLVPEQRDFYESWVEFKVVDADGKTICHSGYLQPDGLLDPAAHSYTNRLVGQDGRLLDQHQVWLTRSRAYDNTIPPGRSDLVRYDFRVPAVAKGPLTVTARVNYRRFRQGYLDFVLGEKKAYPVAVMALQTFRIGVGQAETQAAASPIPEWMRWNNYGIALLGQQQYSQAIEAFEQVVKLRPEYADGYTNIALSNYSYEKYEPAKQALARALELAPGDARANFYLASIYRIEGKLDQAAPLFQRVLDAYPRLREARRELGTVYYQRGDYARAREQFEQLQGIDPDDLAAHYNLALIYRRLGLKEKATQQETLFADRRDDPTTGSLSLDFLARHPDVSVESVPWHKHSGATGLSTGAEQASGHH
jgi:tetratricopeptide (TPR) repeat protein